MIEYDEFRSKITEMDKEVLDLADALKISDIEKQKADLESKTSQDGFWDDIDAAQKVQQKIKQISDKIAAYNALKSECDDLSVLLSLAEEENDESMTAEIADNIAKVSSDIENMRLSTLLSGEYDGNNAILTFHAGAGGTEAQDWASMLYRMYTRFAERKGYKYKILDYLDGEEAGIKSATILVEGINAYGFLKSEMGVHRLVRISPFDASGRRHTSFASVEVMPEIDDDTEIEIRDEDLKIDTYRSSGAGGQHVNKTESAIRITHIPTGIIVACQNERSQHQNKEVAMKMLRSKLIEIKEREHLDKIEDIKGEQKDIAWGSQIRSYVFMPYTLAKDHRTGCENGNITAVMDGEIDEFINAYLKQQVTK